MTQLTNINERQGKQERKAAELITTILHDKHIPLIEQSYQTIIPVTKKAILTIDGQPAPCLGTALRSGTIKGKYAILSSLISSQRFLEGTNINFNPHCPGISRSNHYFAPSIAVSPKVLDQICRAKNVTARVVVERQRHPSQNLLIGNTVNPSTIIFCHYDSLGPGAIDNASGTALLLRLAIEQPYLRTTTLYVIAGNEEISYDYPIYWGHGYRVFEMRYKKILNKAKQIIVVDSVGNGRPKVTQEEQTVRLGFPIRALTKLLPRISLVHGDIDQLMSVYHSDLDTMANINPRAMEKTYRLLVSLLKNEG